MQSQLAFGVDEPRNRLLPTRRPLVMPAQDLRRWQHAPRPQEQSALTLIARGCLVVATVVLTIGLEWGLFHVLSPGPWSVGAVVLMLSSFPCFAWISFGSANALIGATKLSCRLSVDTLVVPDIGSLASRNALLFPIYHEDIAEISATIRAVSMDLAELACADVFDIFVLSDSQSDAARRREVVEFAALRQELLGIVRIHYRNRSVNARKKVGNIQDWVENFGAAYDHFIIFDADSLMRAELLVRLARAMEDNAEVGLIQTVPQLIGARTVFARLQQFAQAYYGPVVAAGYAAWQGDCGNYWGHNAIIRTTAFAQSAGLPLLPGRPPFGGAILSHDFVEAALMRRAGWGVHLAPSLSGSFEKCPPTLPDLAVRDRRWAQGNLQHVKVLTAAGLVPTSRLLLSLGILAYLVSAFWAITLFAGMLLTYQAQFSLPRYFPAATPTLFPIWPAYNSDAALYLLLATACVLLLPKLLGIMLVRHRGTDAPPTGRLVAGFLVETAASMLVAPVMMLLQLRAVGETLLGHDSGWPAQSRHAAALSWRAALKFHQAHVASGLVLGAICLGVSWQVLAWMTPIVAGLVLSPALSAVTSREFLDSVFNSPHRSLNEQVHHQRKQTNHPE
jgi:membrane glycosyltransferase